MMQNTCDVYAILNEALDLYQPSHVFAMFSGGYDSLVTTHLTAQHPQFSGVLHINTGIGIEQTREFVRATCHMYGWPLHEYQCAESYETWVLNGGFPGPAQHTIMYNRLKDRAIWAVLRDYKTHRRDRIAFVTGARRHESTRRMGNAEPHRRHKTQVWINPIINWSRDDVLDYKDLHQLPTNWVVDVLHMSGECLCGAFADTGELALIETFFPKMGGYLRDLEQRVHAAGYPWGWDEAPPGWWQMVKRGQLGFDGDGFFPLCTSCDARYHALTQTEITP